MARKSQHPGVEAEIREILSIIEIEIGFTSFRFAKPEEDWDYPSEDNIALLPVPGHVAALEHARIAGVHG